mgnify:CR=1 FL=1
MYYQCNIYMIIIAHFGDVFGATSVADMSTTAATHVQNPWVLT